jgi:hypothetical protein
LVFNRVKLSTSTSSSLSTRRNQIEVIPETPKNQTNFKKLKMSTVVATTPTITSTTMTSTHGRTSTVSPTTKV